MRPAPAANYEVGPGKPLAAIGEVPWESLAPGDTVLIHARPEPYREKWVICRQGAPDLPITVRGVPDAAGAPPIIDGDGAATRPQLNFWSETRGVIKIGGANSPPDTMPQCIVIENLAIRGARPPHSFTGRDGPTDYDNNSAAIYIEKGTSVTLRNCVLTNCGNGLFAAWQTTGLLVESCHIYGNGIEDSIYEHNNYTEANGITFQFNHFGPLRAGCPGNNLKDRSAGLVVRHNWIESGNRQLDLVDSGHDALYNLPAYRTTRVYGNILIEPEGAGNNQVCHYGGDSGAPARYRKGTLQFYHNTVVSTRAGNTTLLRLSSNDESADCRNSIVMAAGALAILDDTGTAELRHNWLKTGWKKSFGNPAAAVLDLGGNLAGAAPGFIDPAAQAWYPRPDSPCVDAGMDLTAILPPEHRVSREYLPPRQGRPRPFDGAPDLGAYEFRRGQALRIY